MITNTSRVAKANDISGLKGQSASVYTTSEVNQSVKNTDSINIIGETAKDVFVPARSIVIVTTDAADHAAPAVSVDENPQLFEENGSYTSRDQILHLSGSVDEQASVTVNGREVALGADFTFTADITLTEGGNIITIETVVLLSKGEIDSKKVRVEFSLEDMDMSDFQDKATYTQIKDYVLEHSGLKVSNLYISQIKRKCGLEVGKNYNLPKAEDSRQPQCPSEKENAIREAMKYFGMI